MSKAKKTRNQYGYFIAVITQEFKMNLKSLTIALSLEVNINLY